MVAGVPGEERRMKYRVAIVGAGVVGQNVAKGLEGKAETWFLDPRLFNMDRIAEPVDYAIVCVPTDKTEGGSADISIVDDVVGKLKAETIVIKSTIPPGTTDMLIDKYKKRIVFSPEYYGATNHANTPHDFLILGGETADCEQAAQLWMEVFTGKNRIIRTTAKCAELIKYAENTWLASQVTFFNTFHRIAKAFDVDFLSFREGLLLDERISRSHSFVYLEHPYYNSHCLNKDVPAIVEASKEAGYDPVFISSIISANERFKNGDI